MRGPLAGLRLPHLSGATVTIAGSPIKFAGMMAVPVTPAPQVGEHTREVLGAVAEPLARHVGTPDPPGTGAG